MASELRAAIRKEMDEKKRGWLKRVDALQWDLDHITATSGINQNRATMGLPAWPDRYAAQADA